MWTDYKDCIRLGELDNFVSLCDEDDRKLTHLEMKGGVLLASSLVQHSGQVRALGKRRLHDEDGEHEAEAGTGEEGILDSRALTLAVIIFLCTVLIIIVIYQTVKLCRSAIRYTYSYVTSHQSVTLTHLNLSASDGVN